MRTALLALENAGKLDVEEEFRQRCFHITVYKSYAGVTTPSAPPTEVVDSADAPALPDSISDAPASASAGATTRTSPTGRVHTKGRRSRHAIGRAARALPA
jgi:hypothetical protein